MCWCCICVWESPGERVIFFVVNLFVHALYRTDVSRAGVMVSCVLNVVTFTATRAQQNDWKLFQGDQWFIFASPGQGHRTQNLHLTASLVVYLWPWMNRAPSHARLPLPASMMVSCNIYRVDFHVCCRGRAKQSGSLGFCPYSALPKHRKQTI